MHVGLKEHVLVLDFVVLVVKFLELLLVSISLQLHIRLIVLLRVLHSTSGIVILRLDDLLHFA